jgi:mannosyltransferase OCH1-like enzyme
MRGKYWNLLSNNEKLNKFVKLKQLSYKESIFDVKVQHFKHIIDVVRINVLIHYGGIYLDNSVILAGDLNKFRHFETTILNGNSDNSIYDKIIIANKNSRFLKAYADSYR